MSLGQCGWCLGDATTTVNVSSGRKLQIVPVCPTHRDLVDREREARRQERERRAAERKNPPVPHWRQS